MPTLRAGAAGPAATGGSGWPLRVKITSRSFSRTPELVAELEALFDHCVGRTEGPPQLDPRALADFLRDADAAVVGLDPLDSRVLQACPRLRAVAKYGVGLDNVDVQACVERGVFVGWTPGVNRRGVAELALGSMLMLLRNGYAASQHLKSGHWRKEGGVQLTGKTVGVVGVGHVGKELIELLRPFRCRVLGNDVRRQDDYYAVAGVEEVDLPTLLAESDVVSLHVPLTTETRHLIDEQAFASMKPGACLINTARGGVVSGAALKRALTEGWIAGAMLDVYDEPEPPADTDLLRLPNLICTPHIGGNARESVLAMGRSAIGHLRDWMAGRPQPPLPEDRLGVGQAGHTATAAAR